MRGAGGCGAAATGGVVGRGALGGVAAGGVEAVIDGAAGAGGATTATGAGAGVTGRTGGAGTTGTTGGAGSIRVAGFSAAGTTIAGRVTGAGVTGAATEGGAGGADAGALAAGGTTVGRGATGTAGRCGGAAAASFFCVIAFSTSPGREMCERSILVLISSSPRSVRAERADGDCASDEPRMWARTFSASCSSKELEWVFFSVTPTSGSASRMALLLTSSSLARSLIRTLLIRPFLYPALRLGLHCILTE